MSGILELMKLCRFCLVKDKVDVPIFGEANDVKQIFMKISACLPVKVSRDDNLPKNICDNCVYKVESLYHFWNTTVSSEKQLIQWLGELGVNVQKPSLHSIQPETVILKQEKEDSNENESLDIFGYNQQYQSNQNPPAETSTSTTTTSNKKTPAKAKTKAGPKRRGRPPGKKTEPPAKRRTRQKEPETSEDDDDSIGADDVPTQDDSDEDFGNRVAKEEQESEDDFDNTDALEPTTYIDVPSENADNDQPGPSGINKPAPITATDVGKKKRPKNDADLEIDQYITKVIKFIPPTDPQSNKNKTTDKYEDNANTNGKTKRKKPEHRNTQSNLNKEKNKCVICSKEVIGRTNTIKHYQIHADQKKKKNKEEAEKSIHNGPLQCSTCLEEFVDKLELQNHEDHYHVQRKYMCAVCNKCYSSAQLFYFHMNKHKSTEDVMKCPDCDFKTVFPGAYIQHISSHPKLDNPFMCQFCGACFVVRKDLYAHRRQVHSGNEKTVFQCKLCLKEYTRKAHLQDHIRSHMGKPKDRRICDICGKAISKNKMKDHLRIHDGLRPYACTYCEKRFTARKYLRDHIRVHTGEKPFVCHYCGKSFSQRTPLTVHLRTHTGETPYVCHICSRGFVSKGALDNHMKNEIH